MRSALRWISLALTGAVLYALGSTGFHHRRFGVFLAAVLGLAALIVAVFLATASGGEGKD